VNARILPHAGAPSRTSPREGTHPPPYRQSLPPLWAPPVTDFFLSRRRSAPLFDARRAGSLFLTFTGMHFSQVKGSSPFLLPANYTVFLFSPPLTCLQVYDSQNVLFLGGLPPQAELLGLSLPRPPTVVLFLKFLSFPFQAWLSLFFACGRTFSSPGPTFPYPVAHFFFG